MDNDVLVVGAGPTGLVLALWLTKQGIRPRIIDKTAGPGTTSRALAVQARTLELYGQLDLAEAVMERGHKVPGAQTLGQGRAGGAPALRGHRHRPHALFLSSNFSAGRA